MSKIIQLYKDSNKTIKVYPKTLASEVYLDENNNIIQELDNKSNLNHSHEEYAIKTEVDNLVNTKANLIHTHGEYAIKTEIEAAINTKAPLTHIHEDYTTETEVQEILTLTGYGEQLTTLQSTVDSILTQLENVNTLLDTVIQTSQ